MNATARGNTSDKLWSATFTLPAAVQEDQAKARCENGVLHLTLPKRPEVKPRKIKIQ